MMRIRAAEEKIVAVYAEKSMQTPTHLSIGQEAVAVGILAESDAVHDDKDHRSSAPVKFLVSGQCFNHVTSPIYLFTYCLFKVKLYNLLN